MSNYSCFSTRFYKVCNYGKNEVKSPKRGKAKALAGDR
ncbi:MAG: hypothetical protein EP319_16385 [Deltaproteobacteria bacterium]|nr:MAG: hypothetical protein EP319_16385 [Deltaproteobacteria bacterium]